jgi:hypothetical protein
MRERFADSVGLDRPSFDMFLVLLAAFGDSFVQALYRYWQSSWCLDVLGGVSEEVSDQSGW